MAIDRTQVLRTLDKADRVDVDGILDLLTKGRRDQSGAFTPGCGLSEPQAVCLLGLLNCVDAQFNPDNAQSVRIQRRFQLIRVLEGAVVEEATGKTAWDVFIRVPHENIGWALDDLWDRLALSREG